MARPGEGFGLLSPDDGSADVPIRASSSSSRPRCSRKRAHLRGAHLVVVNQGETPLDDRADLVLRGPIDEMLPRIVGQA